MAKVNLNPVLENMRGKIGDLVFKRYGDEVVVARKPDPSGRPPTAGQQAVREQFKLAAIYGKAALADPARKALYQGKAKAKGVPVFAVTIADFFNAPVVNEIDLSAYTGQAGQAIHIRASDDFEVTGVGIIIRETGGTVVEEGPAARGSDGAWTYAATTTLTAGQNVIIEVTATDRPGHKGTKSQPRF